MGTIELRNKWKETIVNVDDRFLRMIDALHKTYIQNEDFYDDIPTEIQKILNESRNDIKNGDFSTHEQVMKDVREKYNIS